MKVGLFKKVETIKSKKKKNLYFVHLIGLERWTGFPASFNFTVLVIVKQARQKWSVCSGGVGLEAWKVISCLKSHAQTMLLNEDEGFY